VHSNLVAAPEILLDESVPEQVNPEADRVIPE
jgi:hypothetical protein